jgi:hypothetical protein
MQSVIQCWVGVPPHFQWPLLLPVFGRLATRLGVTTAQTTTDQLLRAASSSQRPPTTIGFTVLQTCAAIKESTTVAAVDKYRRKRSLEVDFI